MASVRSLILGTLLLPAAATAQQADTVQLPELVVTATRTSWQAGAAPAATTVLAGDDLRARGVRFVADALREVPGLTVVQTGSYGAVSSAFLRGGESDYLKVLVDGIPLNAPGGSLNLADLSLDDVDRIEVVRGPVSVLYGADAVSGVVQLFTRSGSGRLHGEASARGGSLGNREAAGRAGGSTGAFRVSAAASSFGSDGIYDFNNDYRSTTGSLRASWDGGARGRVAVNARVGDVRAAFPTDGSGMPVDRNQYTTEESLLLGIEAARPLGGRVSATALGFARRVDAGARNRPDGPADTSGFGFDAERDARTWRRGVEGRLDWDPAPRARVSLGVGIEREEEAQQSRTVSNFGGGAFTEAGTFAAERTTRQVHAQLLLAPTSQVTVQAGVRLDDNSAFGTFTTARAGLTFQVGGGARVWVAAGTAFKAPTFSELFATSAFEVGNPTLTPERSRSAEFGLEQGFAAGRVLVTATAFSQTFRDLIQYVSAPAGQPTYANLQGADARGVELALVVRPAEALRLRAHATRLATEVTDTGAVSSVAFRQGEALLRRPGVTAGLTGTLALTRAVVGLGVTVVGSREDADFRDFPAARVTLPSYVVVDASLDVPVVGGRRAGAGMDLTLRGENLLDAAYEQVVGFPGRGRTVMAGARLRF